MMKETVLARSLRQVFTGGAMALGLSVAAQSAMAQEVPSDAPIQRVEVTGSAIKRIDAETSVPVTVMKLDDLKKQGFTTIEQVMSNLSSSQASQGTSQVVGLSTGGASFADLRGIGANKTLVLLNGRRLANNAFDSSAPDLNMIPFAALDRVEVLRDGASALYGSDAVGGVINFITKKDYQGATITVGGDSPQHPGGAANNANIGFGYGDLEKQGWNVFAMVDHEEQHRIGGTQRPYNTRYAGGLSPTTSPANYYQGDASFNPAGGNCASQPNLIAGTGQSCQMTTSSFVDYVPKSERTTGLLKGTLKINENNQAGLEYFASQSKVQSAIAPVPYGGLLQNKLRPDGSLNPYYPGNGSVPLNGATLDPNYTDADYPDGAPGFIHVKWRDLPNGSRADENINKQQRAIASLTGNVLGWDYDTALAYNENKVTENLKGYSNGDIITAGVLNGIINPFGAQDAAGTALINSAALDGTIQQAKGTSKSFDFHASREVGDWLHTGNQAALAIGGQADHQSFLSAANTDYAEKVQASTGIDPNTRNEGSRNVYGLYAELNVPILKNLDLTGAVRYDKYSDVGNTTNPKLSFRYQPTQRIVVRGSFGTGFRAPSLYEINAAQSYTNSSIQDDPVNCPGGSTATTGKPSAANCGQQFQELIGGNKNLQPEKSQNATFGIVLEPIDNVTLGIDFWAISLRHTIGVLNEDDIFADPTKYASVYHRTASGNLATDGSQCPNPATCGYIDLRNQNLGGTLTNGIDLSATYRLRTKDYGVFNFTSQGTYVHRYEYQNSEGGEWLNNLAQYSGNNPVFRWQGNATMAWTKGALGAGLTAHYKSGYRDQDQGDGNPIQVASYTTFDGYGTYTIKGFTLTAGVRNLFDRDPPLSYQTTTFQAGYDPRYTDPSGRTYYLRGTYNF